ncbi:hypothetical protein SAMN05444370_10887 [Rubrimonas cliftonensis]|uniref:Uncharacterized protein n=2 Tax=Rubrimonas cliftonensis TaxID=89524 RepID=A0A1H4CX95_9RHOB|nr:hypothetical protein SAMN05444370_10887 [Rubrimonas cliftonensis]
MLKTFRIEGGALRSRERDLDAFFADRFAVWAPELGPRGRLLLLCAYLQHLFLNDKRASDQLVVHAFDAVDGLAGPADPTAFRADLRPGVAVAFVGAGTPAPGAAEALAARVAAARSVCLSLGVSRAAARRNPTLGPALAAMAAGPRRPASVLLLAEGGAVAGCGPLRAPIALRAPIGDATTLSGYFAYD